MVFPSQYHREITTMAHLLHKRPFPRNIFTNLSKVDCENFLEVLHYTTQADTPEHLRQVLILFQNYFPFTRSLGGLVRLGPKGVFAGFSNVVNASYPDEWLYLYWKEGFADIDPVFKSALRSPGTQHWQEVYQSRGGS